MNNFTKFINETSSASISSSIDDSAGGKCSLDTLCVVRVSGSDAESFLNGQFTTDISQVTTSQGQLSAWCDPKGRVLFMFIVVRTDDEFHLILSEDTVEAFVRRLAMYVLRADVAITPALDQLAIFGVVGDAIGQISTQPECETSWSVTHDNASILIRSIGTPKRHLVVATIEHAIALWETLQCPMVDGNAWNLIDIRNGLPHIVTSTSGEFLPQQMNLDALNAVSFSKGCYPGQEIIARLKYRGEVKKRLAVGEIETGRNIEPGSKITDGDGRTTGQVLYASPQPGSRQAILAVTDAGSESAISTVDGAAVQLGSHDALSYPDETAG